MAPSRSTGTPRSSRGGTAPPGRCGRSERRPIDQREGAGRVRGRALRRLWHPRGLRGHRAPRAVGRRRLVAADAPNDGQLTNARALVVFEGALYVGYGTLAVYGDSALLARWDGAAWSQRTLRTTAN